MCLLIIRGWPECHHTRCTSTEKCRTCLSTPGMMEYDCPNAENVFTGGVPDWPCPMCEFAEREGLYEESVAPSSEDGGVPLPRDEDTLSTQIQAALDAPTPTATFQRSDAPSPSTRRSGTPSSTAETLVDTPAWVEAWVAGSDSGLRYRGTGGAEEELDRENAEQRVQHYRYGMGGTQRGEER